ncbi:MAG: serine protease [Betaproteobacteria bacterium]|nr:serine protease [Betaproteobacteria bacterium]
MRVSIRVCISFAVAVFAVQAQAKTASEIFEQASPSVVVVYGADAKGKKQSQGSGVVLPGGEVATNCHVLKGALDYSIHYSNKTYPATIRHSDWDRDVCSLTVPGLNAMPATLGATRNLKVGQRVYVIGAPRGLELTLSEGIVSSLREMDGGRYIQTTAPISPGSSGGGLFDDEGRLIGLPTFYLDKGQQLNFAVPVEWVKALPERHASQAQTEQDGAAWLNKAGALVEKKDWPALLRHAQRWTEAQPRSAEAWNYLGRAYEETGQDAKMFEAKEQALRIKPDDALGWFLLGLTYELAGQLTKAIEAYQQDLRIDPNADKWAVLGHAYKDAGQLTNAIDAYQQAVRIKPERADWWQLLGKAYIDSGQLTKAIEAYRQALRIDQNDAGSWFYLGLAYSKSSQTSKAIEAYQQAVRIDPKESSAWHNLGIAYVETGQFSKAIEAFQQALRIDQKDADAWYGLGITYKKNGQTSKVMEIYRKLSKLDPDKAEQFFNEAILP